MLLTEKNSLCERWCALGTTVQPHCKPLYGPEEVPLAVSVTGRYPSQRGAPVHVGDPDALGIRDLDAPEFGEPVEIEEGQIPVFWACGVTPQAVVMKAKPPLVITHSPGHMFVTDRRHSEYEV